VPLLAVGLHVFGVVAAIELHLVWCHDRHRVSSVYLKSRRRVYAAVEVTTSSGAEVSTTDRGDVAVVYL
jgi:hypothetical protein